MDTNKNNSNNSSQEAKAYLPPAEDVILKFMNKRTYKGTFIDFGCNDGYFTFTSENPSETQLLLSKIKLSFSL